MTMSSPEMIIVEDIKTELWNDIIDYCKSAGWEVSLDYNGIDKGIDYDYVILKKGNEKIHFAWDNWFEGTITCSEPILIEIETGMKINLPGKRSAEGPPEQKGNSPDQ